MRTKAQLQAWLQQALAGPTWPSVQWASDPAVTAEPSLILTIFFSLRLPSFPGGTNQSRLLEGILWEKRCESTLGHEKKGGMRAPGTLRGSTDVRDFPRKRNEIRGFSIRRAVTCLYCSGDCDGGYQRPAAGSSDPLPPRKGALGGQPLRAAAASSGSAISAEPRGPRVRPRRCRPRILPLLPAPLEPKGRVCTMFSPAVRLVPVAGGEGR